MKIKKDVKSNQSQLWYFVPSGGGGGKNTKKKKEK